MNQVNLVHVTSEIVLLGGMALYFSKKHKKADERAKDLEERISKLEHYLHAANKHIKNLYTIIERVSSSPSSRDYSYTYTSPLEKKSSLRHRKNMKVVDLPPDSEEEYDEELEDTFSFSPAPVSKTRSSRAEPSNPPPAPRQGMFSGFPLEAIFGMMSGGGNPLEGFMSAAAGPSVEPSDTSVSVQIEEDNDNDDDIQKELQNLLSTSPSESTPPTE
jgi:hypothetical protein